MYLNHYGQLHVRTYDSNYVFQVRAPLDPQQTWVFASTGIHGLKVASSTRCVRWVVRDLTSCALAANKHNGCSVYVLVDAASHGGCSFLQPTFRERPGASTLCQTLLPDELTRPFTQVGSVAARDKLYGLSAMLLKNFLIFRADLDDGLQAVGNEAGKTSRRFLPAFAMSL